MRLPRLLPLVLCAALAACSRDETGGPTPPVAAPAIDALVGELHLHQFTSGSHASANFVQEPIPYDGHLARELVYIEAEPTDRVGTCSLYLPPSCQPACGGGTFCAAPDICKDNPTAVFVNGGPILVEGAAYSPRIELWFDAGFGGYSSDPPPSAEPLFAGGETLHIEGGAESWRYSGSVLAPARASLIAPEMGAPMPYVSGKPFEIRWVPDGDRTVSLVFLVEDATTSGYVRCYGPDTGALTIDAALTAQLPAEPVRVRLELDVTRQIVLPLAQPGLGVVVHVADSAWLNDLYNTGSP
jgi:hypothetical protein